MKMKDITGAQIESTLKHPAFQPEIFKAACAEVARRMGPGAGPKGDKLQAACVAACKPEVIAAACLAVIANPLNCMADRDADRAAVMGLIREQIAGAMRVVVA